MTTYLLVDTANTFFRARHVAHRGMDQWTRLGFAMHVTMSAVNKAWRIAGAGTIDILSPFVQLSGLDVIESRLFDALQNGAQIRLLVSDYLYISAPQALDRLLGWCESAQEEATAGRLSVRLIEIARLPS